jgi:hypothetical protein
MFGSLNEISGNWILIWLTVTNGAASAWFGYDQVRVFLLCARMTI